MVHTIELTGEIQHQYALLCLQIIAFIRDRISQLMNMDGNMNVVTFSTCYMRSTPTFEPRILEIILENIRHYVEND